MIQPMGIIHRHRHRLLIRGSPEDLTQRTAGWKRHPVLPYRAKAVLPFAQSLDEGCQRRRMRCRNPGHIDQPAPGQREHTAPLLGLIGLYRPHRSYRHTVEAETGEQLLGEPGLAAAAVTLDQ